MFSDPFYGKIHFRSEVDISTGRMMPNYYHGQRVPAHFIEMTAPQIQKALTAELPSAFDPEQYYLANPDVKLSGVDAAQHWLQYGKFEGRHLKPL